MKADLAYRFWRRAAGALYRDCSIHEGVSTEEFEKFVASVRAGRAAPVRNLAADQYAHIWAEQDQPRQILVSTFNALHLILGLQPPAHRSMYGRGVRDAAQSLQALPGGRQAFQRLLKSVDLVIVDEGHYEPAYSWAQAVRAIGKPTIILSATPYRNDYKYFQIDGNFVFNLPWQEAVRERLIREVSVEAPVPPRGGSRTRKKAAGGYSATAFAEEFARTLDQLPPGKRAIVHAATFDALKALQRAFWAKGEPVVLIHDAFEGKAEKACPDLAGLAARARECLKALRFKEVEEAVDDAGAQAARVWMHQLKLLEGVDDSRFVEIWLYDGLGSARQLVQQIGRAIRRPDLSDPTGQRTLIRGSSKQLDAYDGAPTVAQQAARRWADYLAYEHFAAARADVAFIAETQLLATVKRAAPAVQYIAGEFRGGHLLDQSPTMAAFLLPRRGIVCRVRDILDHKPDAIPDAFLDRLQDAAMEAMLLEERFDIAPVPPLATAPYKDIRLIRYLAWSNSPYLARHHIPEWSLGLMAMVRAGRYLFILDTEGVCVDYARLGLLSPEPGDLQRLFPEAGGRRAGGLMRSRTRIVETAASGLDISELGLRSISVRKHALDEGYFDLAEASQVPTSVRGYGQLGDRTARRRLSFSRSSVADATNKLIPVKDYVAWTNIIANAIADEQTRPHGYFNRFARQVRAPVKDEGAPQSILLDLWDLLDVSDESTEERRWKPEEVDALLQYDTCCEVREVQSDCGKPPRYVFDFGPHELQIDYIYRDTIPPAGRYVLSAKDLNTVVAEADEDTSGREVDPDNRLFGRRLSTSLTRLINQDQSFRIVPGVKGVVYSHGHFYRPEINEAVLSILEPSAGLATVNSEKGDTRVTDPALWSTQTLFGLAYSWARDAPGPIDGFARDFGACGLIICDDRNDETADFYCVDETARRLLIVHAKADQANPGASARKLQEVTRQAQASLAFAGSSRRPFGFPGIWRDDWSVKLKDAGGVAVTRTRLLKAPGLDAKAAHKRLIAVLADPNSAKEVVMLTSGILSAKAAAKTLKSTDPRELQFLYFLASVRSTFDRAGVRYRIVCNP
jgi:hypothetical protein